MDKNTNEDIGSVWAFNFIYSGDFQASVQVGQYKTTRVQMGMNPTTFGWTLSGKEKFVSPEAVLVYTDKGLNTMSQIFINCIEINFVEVYIKKKLVQFC